MSEDRIALWKKWDGDKPAYLEHPWLHYDRYFEANKIVEILKGLKVEVSKLGVLDYGCGVGDYGITFARLGATAYLYDIDDNAVRFAVFRHYEEELYENVLHVKNPVGNYDLVIFGEVLEHIDNPLQVLKDYIDNGVKYIFTSSYPYRSDDPKDPYWHRRGHRDHGELCELQKPCRKILEENYSFVKFNGECRLWYKKEV